MNCDVNTYFKIVNVAVTSFLNGPKTMKRISINFLNAQLSEKSPEKVFIIRKKLHVLLHFKHPVHL